jgi:hypothetical protein
MSSRKETGLVIAGAKVQPRKSRVSLAESRSSRLAPYEVYSLLYFCVLTISDNDISAAASAREVGGNSDEPLQQ